jgi:hypothetical protein
MFDPIVEEVRQIREEQAARFNYDPDAIFDHFKRLEQERGWTLVTLPPNRIVKPATVQDRPGGRAA